jgi:hypothetical protein
MTSEERGGRGGGMIRDAAGKVLAFAVLLLAAFVLFKVVLGFLSFLAWTVIAVVAVVAVLWALNRLL